MRATLVNHRYLPFRGGSELYMQKLAEWLTSRGWAVRVITTDAFDLEYFWDRRHRAVDAPPTECINGVHVERLKIRHSPGSSLLFQGGRRALGEASRLLRMPQPFELASSLIPRIEHLDAALRAGPLPDLMIGANLGLESLAISGVRAARELGIPFVLLPFTHLGDGARDPARRYVSMPHQRKLVREADLVVALTRLEGAFLTALGAEAHRVCVAGAGVELERKHAAGDGRPQKQRPFTVLSVGALARDKGTPDLVEASRMLRSAGYDHRLVLVGPELSAFASWFRESGADRCAWIERRGIVSEAEKSELFREADVFALPSRTESFGIVYLEAWAQRLAVVGARVGAVAEVIRDGVDGLLVPFGNPTAITWALERLIESPELASSLGNAGYAKIERCFTWDAVFERVEAAIERVLGIKV